MQILVVNDDGIESLGVWALAGALREAGLGEVTLVAPEVEQSGTSMALPSQRGLTIRPAAAPIPACDGIRAYAFSGTPVGCVLAGVRAGLCPRPDVVVAGINRGLNSGTNVLISGTVGAAMLGAMWGLPALAVSQMFIGDAPMPWGTATWAALKAFPLL
ncbi:MAG: 5'/3'-nucleotidase SurE, partial [Chloroflexales bacterium]|nr:5'/3'-nucleotidase SurE [Chloroflexales bacterium]